MNVAFHVTLPTNAIPVARLKPAPVRWALCVPERSCTTITYRPAARLFTAFPLAALTKLIAFAVTVSASRGAAGVAGGWVGGGVSGGAAPTVNDPFMFAGCASQMNVYVPSTRLSENVFAPIVGDAGADVDPGPLQVEVVLVRLVVDRERDGPRVEVGDAGAVRVDE